MAQGLLFWLFVTKMTIQQDNDVLPSSFLSANAASAESGDQPEVGKWFCQYCRALFDDGGRWVVMLDNKLYLVSVEWFLRGSHVDRGTRGSNVVVGTDLSKRKVFYVLESYSLFLWSFLSPVIAWLRPPNLCFAKHSLRMGWRNFYPVVLLCQFFCSGGK